MNEVARVGLAFEVAFVCGKHCGCVSSPVYSLLLFSAKRWVFKTCCSRCERIRCCFGHMSEELGICFLHKIGVDQN